VKLGKTARWILAIAVVVIAIVAVGVVYNRQRVENAQLNSAIDQAQTQLNYNIAQKRDLETRLSQASSQLSGYQTNFQKPTESIEIEQALFATADSANVHISSLGCSGPSGATINGVNYKVFSLSLSIQGSNMAALINFMGKLNERFPNSSIGSVNIGDSGRTLSLSMSVYTYG
jgi:hypothetical protein